MPLGGPVIAGEVLEHALIATYGVWTRTLVENVSGKFHPGRDKLNRQSDGTDTWTQGHKRVESFRRD